jgi:hypothetical protein
MGMGGGVGRRGGGGKGKWGMGKGGEGGKGRGRWDVERGWGGDHVNPVKSAKHIRYTLNFQGRVSLNVLKRRRQRNTLTRLGDPGTGEKI